MSRIVHALGLTTVVVLASLALAWPSASESSTAPASGRQSIAHSADVQADFHQLLALSPDAWLDLTIADLGEAWWIVHEAQRLAPDRLADYTLAVRIDGRIGYIDTQRLDDPVRGRNLPYVLADLFQSHPKGNFSILVSGATAPHRPLGNPLRWRGFVWEGLEPPGKRVGDVFEQVAVMPRTAIDFNAALGFGRATSADQAPTPQLPDASLSAKPLSEAQPEATLAPAQPPGQLRDDQQPPEHQAVDRALSALRKPASRQSRVIPRTLVGEADAAPDSEPTTADRKLRRVTRVNTQLRRRVAYLEALLLGPELGRAIDLDAPIRDLIALIMQGEPTPQRNVFLRVRTGKQSKVGRIVSASRYPLYRIGATNRGAHQVFLDIEVRGPDGRTILKTQRPNGGTTTNAAAVPDSPLQFRHVQQNTTLRQLGVSEAVWWPVRRQRS